MKAFVDGHAYLCSQFAVYHVGTTLEYSRQLMQYYQLKEAAFKAQFEKAITDRDEAMSLLKVEQSKVAAGDMVKLESEIQNLKVQSKELNENLSAAEARRRELETSHSADLAKLTDLNKELASSQSDLASVRFTLEAKENLLATTSSRVSTLENENLQLKEKMDQDAESARLHLDEERKALSARYAFKAKKSFVVAINSVYDQVFVKTGYKFKKLDVPEDPAE